MPPGMDNYDVVIGVEMADRTAAGSASVRNSTSKLSNDIRQYGDKQARDFARTSREIFSHVDQTTSRSAAGMMTRVTRIFDQNNFLIRQFGREVGGTAGYIAVGLGKIALSWDKLGKDTSSFSHAGRVALQDIKSAVSNLGSDPSAFPSAIKATRELSAAYIGMGNTGHAASLKAGNALEDAIHKRLVTLQGGLQKTQSHFEKLKSGATKDSEAISRKINEITGSVHHLLGQVAIDVPFFKSFASAKTDLEKYALVFDKFGRNSAVAFARNQTELGKLTKSYTNLESKSARLLENQTSKLSGAASEIKKYTSEIAAVEGALTGAAGAAVEDTVATTGLTTAMLAGGVAIGVFIAAVLVLIAAGVVLAAGIWKVTNAAASYGEEIYQAQKKTGIAAEQLSVYNVIAVETGTTLDKLSTAAFRTERNISVGLGKATSEQARAFRTLKIDTEALRTAKPGDQLIMVAKALDNVTNADTKARAGQALTSRAYVQNAAALHALAVGYDEAKKKADAWGLVLTEQDIQLSHEFQIAYRDMGLAVEGFLVTLGKKAVPEMAGLFQDITHMLFGSRGDWNDWANAVADSIAVVRIAIAGLSHNIKVGAIVGKSTGDPILGISASLADIITGGDEGAITDEIKKILKEREDLSRHISNNTGEDGAFLENAKKARASDMDRLEKQVKKLRFELQALQDLGSKPFQLRFELEDLQKVKSGFETIFKLRNEMGLVLDSPVPQFRVFGTQEEQQQDLANIKSYIVQVERMKSVFDGVRKVAAEQGDALSELARVQQESSMPVTDAGTLAQIKYYTAIRDRAKAEKELTADVISEAKLRKEAIEDEVGSNLKAYQTLQRDLGRSQDTTRNQRAQDEMFVRILHGSRSDEQALRDSLKERMGSIEPPAVPTELMAIAAHAATIDLNVASIAEKIGASVTNTTSTNINAPASQTGYATTSLVRRNPDGTVSVIKQNLDDEVLKTQTTDPGYLKQRILDESKNRIGGERAAEIRKANQDITDNEMRMNQDLISIDDDYLNHYHDQQVSRRLEARQTTVSIMLLEKDLSDLDKTNSKLYQRTWAEADKARLESQKSIKNEIITLQNSITNNGFDQADREKKAYFQAIRDIQEASNQARESIIYNQVKISDATIYHADIANARVMEFLANQRSITEVIADAKTGVIDTTFSAIDKMLDKFTSKLGLAGNLVKDLLSGFLRLALSPFFKSMYGGSNSGSMGNNGLFGFPGLGNKGEMGPGGTPLFNGLSGLGSLFSGGTASALSPGSMSSGSAANPSSWQRALAAMNGGATGSSSGFGGMLEGLVGGVGSILPMVGASVGVSLGGSSRFGSILGGIGGAAAGIAGIAGLATLGLGGASLASMAAFLAPIAGIAAIVAAPLIIGAIILARNAARRKDEKTRDVISNDTGTAIWALIDQARLGDMTQIEANAAWNKIDADYHSKIAQLKDGKTRRHAEQQWTNDFLPLKKILDKAVEGSMERANIRERMIPVFGGGGWSNENQLIKVRPGEGIHYPGSNVVHTIFGRDRGFDTEFMYVPKGTRIINRQEMNTATPMITGGIAGAVGMNSSSNDLPELHIDSMEISFDGDGLANIVIKSPNFKRAVIHNVKVGKKEKKIA